MASLLQLSYEEVINWGEDVKYQNFKYGGIILEATDSFNEVITNINGTLVTRTYEHMLPIPDNMAYSLITEGDGMLEFSEGPSYNADLHTRILASYEKCCGIIAAYIYSSIMNTLIEEYEFKPSEDDWEQNLGSASTSDGIVRENSLVFCGNNNFMISFCGKSEKSNFGSANTLVYAGQFSLAYLIHHSFLTFGLMSTICKAMGLPFEEPEKEEEEEDKSFMEEILADATLEILKNENDANGSASKSDPDAKNP